MRRSAPHCGNAAGAPRPRGLRRRHRDADVRTPRGASAAFSDTWPDFAQRHISAAHPLFGDARSRAPNELVRFPSGAVPGPWERKDSCGTRDSAWDSAKGQTLNFSIQNIFWKYVNVTFYYSGHYLLFALYISTSSLSKQTLFLDGFVQWYKFILMSTAIFSILDCGLPFVCNPRFLKEIWKIKKSYYLCRW